MKVYEALAAAFAAEGTTDVFGMMGDANMHWMNALASRGTRLYEVRHEGAGLSMAHGYARASGRPLRRDDDQRPRYRAAGNVDDRGEPGTHPAGRVLRGDAVG